MFRPRFASIAAEGILEMGSDVGSIFRTADAAGVGKIYLCGITPKPVDRFGEPRPQLTKVSLGAEKSVPWEYMKRTSDAIKKFKKDGYKILAVEQSKKSLTLYYFQVSGKLITAFRF